MEHRANIAHGFVYSAMITSRILGIPDPRRSELIPEGVVGEIVICYGGWSLPQLRLCSAGRQLMPQRPDWYDHMNWTAKPGYYRLLLPVPGSKWKKWDEQVAHLRALDTSWEPAPVSVALTALLTHLAATGYKFLHGDTCRCAQALPNECRVGLTVNEGRVNVYYGWDAYRHDRLWLAGCRKL